MFNSIWRRLTQWQSRITTPVRRPSRTRLRIEVLEDRVTPTNIIASISNTTLTLTKVSGNAELTIASAGIFQEFTVTDAIGNTINGLTTYTTPTPVTAMVIKLGSGTDSLTFDGVSNGAINLTGPTTPAGLQTVAGTALNITGSGNKTIAAQDLFLLNNTNFIMTLGNGTEQTTFTDSNITGTATITHGSGATSFAIDTSAANTSALNSWGSLSITNGAGADQNSVQDTHFTGNVTINNGAGDGTTDEFGGSENLFSDGLNPNPMTIGGNLTITTTTGQTDTEVYDYNVHGTLMIGAGAGIANQAIDSFVGVEDNQTTTGSAVPTFGNVVITGGAPADLTPALALAVYVGTNPAAKDFPLQVTGNFSISTTGTGSVGVILNDLNVGGTATVTTASSKTSADTITVLGDQATSTYGALTIASASADTNDINLQVQKGTLDILGALNVKLGNGNDTVDVGSTTSTVQVNGSFGLTGTGGNKVITVLDSIFGGMNWALSGTSGSETALFTDTNETGTAAIDNSLTGNTAFTINTSTNNVNALNTWGNLSITNGTGSDINNITDTDFTGNVTINNGAGAKNDFSQFGGSQNIFTVKNNNALLNIHGNLTITTTSGQSDTEVYDYNVGGNVVLGAGAGVASQSSASLVGLENNQILPLIGTVPFIPTIGGSVTITGGTQPSLNPALNVFVGTDIANQDFPLVIGNGVNANITGTGAASVALDDLTVAGTSDIAFGSTTTTDTVNIRGDKVLSSFGTLTIAPGGTGIDTVNLQTQQGTLDVAGALNVNFGKGTDTLNIGLNAAKPGNVAVTGSFGLTGTGGSQTITALESTFGSMNWALSGTGPGGATLAENALFTDDTVTGVATIKNTLSGDTSFTINTSATNLATFNTWGGLAITNGKGADFNSITDTDFTGNVSISNGTGDGTQNQFGGSETIFSDNNDVNLLAIHGSLSISTGTGQSDTEVFDYNVHGAVALAAGAGIAGQNFASLIGLEDNQTVATSGVPVIGGAVTITGTAITGIPTGLIVNLGTNGIAGNNFPLILQSSLALTTTGSGAAKVTLNDLNVANGATTVTMSGANDSFTVQSSSVTSIFSAFTINSTATGTNTWNLQDQAGNLEFTGTVNIVLGSGVDTLDVAADSINTTGVNGASIDFFGKTTFNGGAGSNSYFPGTYLTNLFYLVPPIVTSFP